MSGEIKIGANFFQNFKTYLKQIGMSEEQISKVKETQAKDVFVKADAADGKTDGKADGEKFLEEIKKEFASANISIEATEQEYLDAWKALAGDDSILETEELAAGEEIEEPEAPKTTGGGGDDRTNPPTNTGDVKPVTEADLANKDSATLRNERSKVLSDINSTRSEMDAAKEAKQKDVEAKKAAYDELLTQLAEASDIKNENDKSLKDLQTDKTNKESDITAKNGEIDQTKSDITTKNSEISDLNSQLNSLEKPNKSKFTTTDDEGNTVTDEAAYNAAMAEYKAQKAELESKIATAEDELAQLELDLASRESELKELENGLNDIETQIKVLIVKIAETDKDKAELADKVAEAVMAYDEAKTALAEAAKPFEEKLATLNANLQVYETAIEKQDAEEAKEKEKWTSDVEGEKGKEYKDKLDELLTTEEPEETEETEKAEETEETEKTEETEETEKEEDKKVLPKENEESFRAILEAAISEEGVSLEDKFRLLNYAKGINESMVKEMLKDDTFFVNAFNSMAKDEKRTTDEVLAMQDVYFDLQGDNEISNDFITKDGKSEGSYAEGFVALTEKAAGEGKLNDLIKNYESKGISVETMKDQIKASNLSEAEKTSLINRLEEATASKEFKPALDVFTIGFDGENIDENGGGYSFTVIYPEDVKEGEELDIVFFCPGAAQFGNNFNQKSQFAENTTIAGQFYSYDAATGEVKLRDSSDYQDKPRCVYIQMSLTKEGMSWNKEGTTKAAKWVLDNKLPSYGITRGKSVLSGASKGVFGAAELARTLGEDYFDSVVYVSGDPRKNRDVKIPEYGYSATTEGLKSSMAERLGKDNFEALGSIEGKDGSHIGANHNTIVEILFNADSDGNGIADFFEKHLLH